MIRSSAYCRIRIGCGCAGGFGRSAVKSEKRVADRTDPCGMPAGHENAEDVASGIATLAERFSKKLSMSLQR